MPTDFKMTRDTDGVYDLTIDPVTGDFVTEDSFDTAILYSFFGERRATDSDVPTSESRRGWIGNLTANYENGSKTWLLEQARLTRDSLNKLSTEAFNGWRWFIDDGLLRDVTVETEFLNGTAGLSATFIRFDSVVDKKFFTLWDNTGTK